MNVGTKIYYCNITGNTLLVIGDLVNVSRDTTFDEDCCIYPELSERNKNTISSIQLNYGEFNKLANGKECTSVNLETKELIFLTPSMPDNSSNLTWENEVNNKLSALEEENADLLLDNAMKDLRLETLENDLADLTLEIAMMGGN
ncbi:hypothetical protein [Romboutsia sp. 1001713B170131_170501_G6]|uniref:hypothetical protein n=1 Tax=Romboutsia sp. 1001713B170131_170501_G6 TaxID=2787108 RepID=UPI0018AB64F7|nr:hypothetical protein [Romboutsia sp. 1001713B170131_170501_G6]